MIFFDSHLHSKKYESGAFLIGLEGEPFFESTLNNDEILKLHNPDENYFSFYYVKNDEIKNKFKHKYLKYHPRREKYSLDEVDKSIELNQPKCVIVDTLNEPFWSTNYYWELARQHLDIIFIFAHSGGYSINDFIKIAHFQKNVYIDFALTHTLLGKLGDETGLSIVNQAIFYALNSSFKNRVLFGSDYPFFSQSDAAEYYKKLGFIELLNKNFLSLVEKIK